MKDNLLKQAEEMKNDLMDQIQKREEHLQQFTNSVVPDLQNKIKALTLHNEELQQNLKVTQDELEKLITMYEEMELMKTK